MRLVVSVGFVAILVALLAWWGSDPPAPGPMPAAAAATGDAANASLAAPDAAGPLQSARERALSPAGAATEGASIAGVVSGPDGRGIGGANVAAETADAEEYPLLDPAPRQRRPVATAVTAADGSYRLPVVANVTCVVRVAADGFAPAVRTDCRAGARVDFRLDRGATLLGNVRRLADGAPVPGTRLVVTKSLGDSSWWCGEATTDAGGGYRIDGLPAGAATVAVAPQRLAPPRDAEVVLHAGHATRHDVPLTDGLEILGRVLDEATQAPIAGARIAQGWRGRVVTSEADGTFVLPGFAPHDNVVLSVEADGYADSEVVVRDGPEVADTRTRVDILLRRGRRASGRVLDVAGRPLADVYVAAVAADSGARSFRSDWRAGRTGVDGTFALDRLRPELPHELFLLRRGFATAVYAFPADEAERTVVELGDFVMQPPAAVAGRVVDEHGAAVADHEVTLCGTNADRWRGAARSEAYRAIDSYVAQRRCRTDAEGRFGFVDVAAGEYEIRAARIDSHEQIAERCEVARGARVDGIELRLFRGLAIAGTVVVADGGTLPKCYCSIDPEAGQGTSADVEVAADGRFQASGLAAGSYAVTLHPYASAADREIGRAFVSLRIANVVAGTTALRCELPVTLPVRGRVLDPQRAAAANVSIEVFDGTARLETIATDAAGAFVVQVPFGRTVRVVASAGGCTAQAFATADGPPVELQL